MEKFPVKEVNAEANGGNQKPMDMSTEEYNGKIGTDGFSKNAGNVGK